MMESLSFLTGTTRRTSGTATLPVVSGVRAGGEKSEAECIPPPKREPHATFLRMKSGISSNRTVSDAVTARLNCTNFRSVRPSISASCP